MKKKIILPIALLFVLLNISMAQQYYPFRPDTAKWSVASWVHYYPGGYYDHATYFYFINGDTIFDTITYSKIYSVIPENTNLIDTSSAIYIGGLREDNQKHIYYKPAQLIQEFSIHCMIMNFTLDEFLLYRFDVDSADSFYLNEYVGYDITVLDTDSVLVDSSYRRRLWVSGPSDYIEWIEGIGDMTSLFGTFCPMFESGDDLLCYEDPSTFYYGPSNSSGRCTYFIVGNSENQLSNIRIFPNPARRTIRIKSADNEIINEIIIYNQMGNKVFAQTQLSGSIDVSDLDVGMYVIEIVLDNFKVRKKLMIY